MESKSALNFVIRISRLAGIAPICDTGNGLRVSRPLLLYSYLLVTAINCVVLSGFALDLLTEPARSLRVRTPTSRIIWVGNLSIIILIASVAVYTSPTRMTSVINCLKEIDKIKVFIGADNKIDSGEKYKFFAVVTTCVGLWVLIGFDLCGYALEALDRGREVRTLLMYSFLFYEYFLVLLAQLQFALVAFHLQGLLRLVNSELRGMSTPDKNISYYLKSKPQARIKNNYLNKIEPANTVLPKSINYAIDSLSMFGPFEEHKSHSKGKRTIKDFAFVYSCICDIFRQIDNDHGLLLFLNVASFFLQLVITPYYLVTELYAVTGYLSNILLQIGWGVYHVGCMILVVEPCYQMQGEMDKTKQLVCSIMRHVSAEDPVTLELDLFYKQLILDRPTYSPLGVCTLSRPLTVTIIGAVTTYLVIIFQFRTYESGDT